MSRRDIAHAEGVLASVERTTPDRAAGVTAAVGIGYAIIAVAEAVQTIADVLEAKWNEGHR